MIPTDFLHLPVPTRPSDREAARRAEEASKLFGGSARVKGLGLNFRAPDTAQAKTSGMASTMDLYAPVIRAEDAKREEIARRMDALPSHIAALPQKEPGLGVDALEALAVIERSSKAMGGQSVAVTRGDIARAIKCAPERAETIISDLERRKLLRRQVTAGVLDYFTVQL
ncbi:hypothetical protein [Microvirga makkahensis]|uniref:Uncharacterized protein n=1 Tax=Microvirga makkahensis TaxID=1128670 RepID=A0A7X3SQY5_9HYPH|nr:hypothetical protein [Microvirga makkahensis]MXQ13982.1 hypothetical protein [Microvirga makkahensis]